MNVLSLFDGMSCGQIALNRVGINVDNYFASELDKYAIKVTQHNYPNTVQLGDVTKVSAINLPKIDLLIGGSPFQGFSLVGKKLNFDDPRSKLFFEYVRILKEIREINPEVKFLLENVKMKKEWVTFINEALGVEGVLVNSSLVSAQNRLRWYWTNICSIEQPKDLGITLVDILEQSVENKYYIKGGRLNWLFKYGAQKQRKGYIAFNPIKAKCLTVRAEPSWNCTYISHSNDFNLGGINVKQPTFIDNLLFQLGSVRKLTPVECERLQTVPDNYTSCVSDTQRYKLLGNGWTVDVIAHILANLKNG